MNLWLVKLQVQFQIQSNFTNWILTQLKDQSNKKNLSIESYTHLNQSANPTGVQKRSAKELYSLDEQALRAIVDLAKTIAMTSQASELVGSICYRSDVEIELLASPQLQNFTDRLFVFCFNNCPDLLLKHASKVPILKECHFGKMKL